MGIKKIRLVVLISGTGRSLQNMLEHIHDGSLSAEVVMVVASTPNAKGLQYAEMATIPIEIVEKKDYENREDFSEAIFQHARNVKADYVVMAGFLKLLEIPNDFHRRVLNIHPSLIPAFCGKGFYGRHVHEEALSYGVKLTGCTVHFVDNEYDRGPVLLQMAIPVLETDTPDSLNDRVFELERTAYPEALQLLAEERVTLIGRKVKIKPKQGAESGPGGKTIK